MRNFLLILIIVGTGYIGYYIYSDQFTSSPISKSHEDALNIINNDTEADTEESETSVVETIPLKVKTFFEGSSTLTREGILASTNAEREDRMLSSLAMNNVLNQAAKEKLDDMIAQTYFEHVSPQGISADDLVSAFGYKYAIVAENLALGNFKNDERMVKAWMDSPGHRKNILNNGFTEIGIAVGRGEVEAGGGVVWVGVQIFATPSSSCNPPSPSLQGSIEARDKSLRNRKVELDSLEASITPANYPSYNEYTTALNSYNSQINQYNDDVYQLRADVDSYNRAVSNFNNCVNNLSN